MNSKICYVNGENKLYINKSAPYISSLILDIRIRERRENILVSSMIDFENVNIYRKVKQILHFTKFLHVLTFCHIDFFSCPCSFLFKHLYSNFSDARPGKLGPNSQCRTLGISILWAFISKWSKGKITNSFNKHFWSTVHHPSSRNSSWGGTSTV